MSYAVADKSYSTPKIWIATAFAAHQIIATLGIMVVTPFALAVVAPALRLFGLFLSLAEAERILTELHYFPLQATFGFLIGCAISYRTRHRVAQWVWVLPAVLILSLIITNHHLLDFRSMAVQFSSSPLSHFFGSGCGPESHCFDQTLVTLPLYSAVGYSLGSVIGRRLWFARHSKSK